MNSHQATVMAVYEGIISDAIATWPESTKSFGKDLSYLRRAMEQRGLPFFTITLPSLGKVLDRSLAKGSFLTEGVPQGIPLLQKRPELFGDLYLKVFHDSGSLRLDFDVNAVAFLRQFCYCCKKLRLQCKPHYVEQTLQEFFDIEQSLPPSYEKTWDDDIPEWRPIKGHPLGEYQPTILADEVPIDWDQFRKLCGIVISSLGTAPFWELEMKHGPGVVSEQSEVVSKYDFPNWPQKLGSYFPYDWFATGRLDGPFNYSEVEYPSRLIAVPKTQKGPRLICAEPTAHQWVQQGIWKWLDKASRSTLLGHSIRFRDQEISRERALEASIDGSLCTIDLSAASDRLSTRLVQYVFQGSPILDLLHACRSRYLTQTLSDNHPRTITLRKFAPMGSATTFPIQSIVFTLLAVFGKKISEETQYKLDPRTLEDDFRAVTVFGDDIIAPNNAYSAITRLLTECGLKVNSDKSFHEGFFRESCGMDAFCGSDVTPAYILDAYDGSPPSMATIVETANNFHKRGYWNAAQSVVNCLPHKERKLLAVLGSEGGCLGLFSFCGRNLDHLQRRWNESYHRWERTVLTVTSSVTKVQGRDWSSLTQYFTERPHPEILWKSGQVSRVKLRKCLTRVVE